MHGRVHVLRCRWKSAICSSNGCERLPAASRSRHEPVRQCAMVGQRSRGGSRHASVSGRRELISQAISWPTIAHLPHSS